MAMPMAAHTPGFIALFGGFDDEASPEGSGEVIGLVLVLVAEVASIVVADKVFFWLVVARLMVV